jgi:outer membrane protein OmpA-like peptidoglycan-associated protein
MPRCHPLRAIMLAGVAALPLEACSTPTTPPPGLAAAQAAYSTAADDPAVVGRAPLELQQARDALTQSQALWQRGGSDTPDVEHYAYLAGRYAQIAQQTARLKTAQDEVQHADAARAQALLGARTAEAEQAQAQAATAQQQADQARQQAQEAQSRAGQLQQQLDKLQSNQADSGPVVLTLGDILFDVGKASLKPGAYDSINQIAAFLKTHPDRTVTIQGYTDDSGAAAYNQTLSQERADAVRTALLMQGVAPTRVVARGYGDSAPIASNATVAGRQLNRRVNVAISGTSPESSTGSSTQ